MSDVNQDPIVDAPASGGIEFPPDMVVTTSDAPVVEEKAVEKTVEEKPVEKTDEKSEFKKPAWVRWTDEGGMRIEPGSGATVDEHGNIVLDPEVAQRMATKRVMRVRDEERARAERLVREERAARERLERELAEARQTKPATEKPWAVKDAPEPDIDDFDSIPEFTKAMLEWDRAQREAPKPAKTDEPKVDSDGMPTRDSFETEAEWHEAVAEKQFAQKHGATIAAMMEEGNALYEDYGEVAGPVVLSREALEVVLESDNAAEVLYHLGSHPEMVEKLQGLEGSKLHKAIGRIEDALGTTPSKDENTSKDTVVSDASTATAKAPSIQPVPVTKPTRGAAPPRTNPVELAAQPEADAFFDHLKSIGI